MWLRRSWAFWVYGILIYICIIYNIYLYLYVYIYIYVFYTVYNTHLTRPTMR
jgi:hypothetical protein